MAGSLTGKQEDDAQRMTHMTPEQDNQRRRVRGDILNLLTDKQDPVGSRAQAEALCRQYSYAITESDGKVRVTDGVLAPASEPESHVETPAEPVVAKQRRANTLPEYHAAGLTVSEEAEGRRVRRSCRCGRAR